MGWVQHHFAVWRDLNFVRYHRDTDSGTHGAVVSGRLFQRVCLRFGLGPGRWRPSKREALLIQNRRF
jgi:hypothetical protein